MRCRSSSPPPAQNSVDAPDIHHARRILGTRGLAQPRQQRDGQVKDPFDVRVQDLVPASIRKLLERCAPRRARVVNQHVQRSVDLCGERAAPFRRREIRRDPATPEFLCGGCHRVGLARGDRDLDAGGDEPPSDLQPDPARPTGHQGALALSEKRPLMISAVRTSRPSRRSAPRASCAGATGRTPDRRR